MNGNFSYWNPVCVYFGEDAISNLKAEMETAGPRVMFSYGGGSIKKNGIYDEVMEVLSDAGKFVIDDGGVMPNPTYRRVKEGIRKTREKGADFILAVGGGSVIDYAKTVAAGVHYEGNLWDDVFLNGGEIETERIPFGTILTMSGTGSEMNSGAVITDERTHLKLDADFGAEGFPRFSILNPLYTMTLPKKQMAAGIYDTFNHICEQYFSGTDDNTSDYIMEGLMRSVIHSSRVAMKNPRDYEARSNLMRCATWALNGLVSCGKETDWMVHMLGQSVGGWTDAVHGMTLSAVSLPYYRYILPYGAAKFARFARNVWDVQDEGLPAAIGEKGLLAMEKWMKDLGLVMNLRDLGVTEEMLPGIAGGVFFTPGGYGNLNENDVMNILEESL